MGLAPDGIDMELTHLKPEAVGTSGFDCDNRWPAALCRALVS
jgi:hypothetical protein